jgi:nicotinate-nucleotide adenylyltransferase
MKIGLFFGSFNPVHTGHLIIANAMTEQTDLEQVWFIVSPQNPLKKSNQLAHEFDRYDMVQLAIEDNPKLKVSDVEFKMPKPSYTIDTLIYLQEKYPQHHFYLIMGSDNLASLHKWKNYEQILQQFHIVVYTRPGDEHCELLEHANVYAIQAPLLDISATYIRQLIKNEKSVRYVVPPAVIQYIEQKKLYH